MIRYVPAAMLLLGCATPELPATPWDIEGGGKADDGAAAPHSAHQHPDMDSAGAIAADIQLRVDAMPDHGLQFFAVELNFPTGTWAHGGLQSGHEADWGGLGQYGYAYAGHEAEVLEHVQNAPGRLSDVPWTIGTWYDLSIEQVGQTTLPAGNYSVLDEPPTAIDHERSFWRWDFSVRDDQGNVVWQQPFYTDAATFSSWSYWTETGYGETCADLVTAHWRSPQFDGVSTGWASPSQIARSIYQSTCAVDATSDIATEDELNQGTIQTFGRPRSPTSTNGAALYAIEGAIGTEYYAHGGATSALGFVTSDEASSTCGSGTHREFQHGEIAARAPTSPAFTIGEPLTDAWSAMGAECGELGYPTAEVSATSSGSTQAFDGGTLTWDSGSGVITFTATP